MPRWNIDAGQATQDLAAMVRINSINPGLHPDGPAEGEMAAWVEAEFKALGLETQVVETAPGRPNVYGRWPGSGGGKSLLLTGHMDVVQVNNMTIPPFEPRIEGDRLYGRGSFDMKAGLASALAAARALKKGGFKPKGDLWLGFVADEEFGSLGTSRLVRDLKPDAAILVEPSDGQIGLAHRGFAWITLHTIGKAAHGSMFDVGVDAITHMGRLLAELDRLEREVMPRRAHPLLGRPSVHASTIEGGTGYSTYPDGCLLEIEHRPLPDEGPDYLIGLWNEAIGRIGESDPTFKAEATLKIYQHGWEIARDAAVVTALDAAYRAALGEPPAYIGMFGWLDSAIIAEAGIPVVIYGPGGEGAHAAVEFADLPSVFHCAATLAELAAGWCR